MKKKIISAIVAAAITVGIAVSALMFAFAGNEPVESWDLYTELSTNLEALANSGVNYVETPIKNLNLGAFKMDVTYYSNVKNLSATALGGKIPGGGNCHNVLELSNGNVSIHSCYSNAVSILWTASKTGKYTIDFSDELKFNGAPLNTSSFKVLLNDVPMAIGENGETELKANGNLKDIDLELQKGDIIKVVVLTGINSSNWAQIRALFNMTIKLMEDLSPPPPLAVFNMADSMRTALADYDYSETASNYTYDVVSSSFINNPFGNFYITSIQAASNAVSETLQEIEKSASEYTLYPYKKNSGSQNWEKSWYSVPNIGVMHTGSTYEGLRLYNKLWQTEYVSAYTLKFVAPEDGVYSITNESAYTGKPGSIYNSSGVRNAYLSIYANGRAIEFTTEADPTVLTIEKGRTVRLPRLENIELDKDDILEFKITMQDVGKTTDNGISVYINFDINLTERKSASPALVSYDFAAEMRKNLSSLDYANIAYKEVNGEKVPNYTYEVIGETMLDYNFGTFNLLSIKGLTSINEVENIGNDYVIHPNKKNTGVEGYEKDYYANPAVQVGKPGSEYQGIGLWNKHYDTAFEYVFTAPSEGVYRINNKSAYKGIPESVYNNYPGDINFSVYVNGVAQNIGEGDDKTTITLKYREYSDIEGLDAIKLNKGDTINFKFITTQLPDKDGKQDWSAGCIYINFLVEATEMGNNLVTSHTTFNVGDEIREKFVNDTELDPVIENNKFGPYTLSLTYREGSEIAKFADANAAQDAGHWSMKTTVYPNPRIVTGITDSLYPGIGLKKQGYSNHALTITFTAPTDGQYRFVPKDCYQGKTGSIYNNYSSGATITVKINDVQQGKTISVPSKATADLPRIDNIKLKKGDTITVVVKTEEHVGEPDWTWFTTYVNYDIDLVETGDDNFYYAGIELSDNIAKAGNETYIELGLTNLMENVSGFSTKIKFDRNLFEFVRAENMSVVTDDFQVADNGAGEVGVVYVSDSNNIGNNNVVRLYFKVKDTVNASTYTMTPTEAQYVRINKNDKSKVEVVNFTNFVTDDALIKVK